MLKKSIPAIIGALLFGTNSEAVVIPCPITYDVNIAKIPPFEFKIDTDDMTNKITFQNESRLETNDQGETTAICVYHDQGNNLVELSFTTKVRCFLGHPGKEAKPEAESLQTCKGEASCRYINCPT